MSYDYLAYILLVHNIYDYTTFSHGRLPFFLLFFNTDHKHHCQEDSK